jgi:4-amino-4-deoxy-L-arabinose transferase-like glycosyltransferase
MWALLAVYAVLALAYSFAQPPFEPSDEQYQFGYVHYLVENRTLPIARRGELSGYHHPPLFFVLAALISGPFPSTDLAEYDARINPYARFRHWEPSLDNKNLYIHGPWDGWPFQDTALAVRVARLLSLGCGLLTVSLTFQLGRTLFDDSVGLAAAGLTAFTPMVTSLTGALQNDMGAAAAGALTLWLGVHLALTDYSLPRATVLGIAAGLATLMKLTAAFVIPPAVLFILFPVAHHRSWRTRLSFVVVFGLSAALVTGWWFARNYWLYGDLTAVNVNLENFGAQTSLWDGVWLWPEMLPYAWTTFWGRIGHGGIVLYDWMYTLPAILCGLACFGLLWRAKAPGQSVATPVLLLGPFSLSCFIGLLIYLTISPTGANGRYAYPALSAYMILIAAGVLRLIPEALRRLASGLVVMLMFVFSAGVLVYFVWPAYAPPPAVAQVSLEAKPLDANLGDTVHLRGYHVSTSEARPGERVYLTVYWEPLSLTDRPYSVYVHLLANDTLIAQRDTYPGLGRAPTVAWEVGRMFADTYLVIIPDDAPAVTAEWKVGLWQAEFGDYAFLLDAAGQPIDSGLRFGSLRIVK